MDNPIPANEPMAGKYRLVRMLGRGGMGSVWEGVHVTLGTHCAIKFIESDLGHDESSLRRFHNEALAAARLQSKHVVQVLDQGVTEQGMPYIVMELLRGESLEARLKRLGTISLADTARILSQVCRGLSKAHQAGIVHRDLKPDNIYLVRGEEDDEETAKILDFGVAKFLQPGSQVASGTQTGQMLGTPYYMSPEQSRGIAVDHRTDIWSLGIIAYRCVAGKLPFDGASVVDLLFAIATAPVPIPSRDAPGLPAAFDDWFARTVARDPADRFSSVMEAGHALAALAGTAGPEPLAVVEQVSVAPIGDEPSVKAGSAEVYSRTLKGERLSGAVRAMALGLLVLAAGGVVAAVFVLRSGQPRAAAGLVVPEGVVGTGSASSSIAQPSATVSTSATPVPSPSQAAPKPRVPVRPPANPAPSKTTAVSPTDIGY